MLGALQLVLGEARLWGYQNSSFVALKAPNVTVVSAAAKRASDQMIYLYADYNGTVFRARGADATSAEVPGAPRAASICAAGGSFYVLEKGGKRVFRTSGVDDDFTDVSTVFGALSGTSDSVKFLACGPLASQEIGVFAFSAAGTLEIFTAKAAD